MVVVTGKDCKIQWKSLSDRYRYYKRSNKPVTEGSARKWKHCQLMTFLDIKKSDSDKKEIAPEPNDDSGASESDSSIQRYTLPSTVRAIDNTNRPGTPWPELGVDTYLSKLLNSRVQEELQRVPLPRTVPEKIDEDELSTFAAHIRTVLKKLPARLQIQAKNEVFQILSKYEMEAVCPSDASSHCSTPVSTPNYTYNGTTANTYYLGNTNIPTGNTAQEEQLQSVDDILLAIL